MKNQVVESGTCKTIIETTFSHFFGGLNQNRFRGKMFHQAKRKKIWFMHGGQLHPGFLYLLSHRSWKMRGERKLGGARMLGIQRQV